MDPLEGPMPEITTFFGTAYSASGWVSGRA